MAKCSECGFLAKWSSKNASFSEAYADFRNGEYYAGIWDFDSVTPCCFVQKANLKEEFFSDEALFKPNFERLVKEFLEKPRDCDGFTPWIQGFSPKEQKQMLLNDAMLESQRALERNSLKVAQRSFMVAVGALLFSVVGVSIGAFVTYKSAGREAEATIRAANSQIEVQREIAKQQESKPPQEININLNLIETKDGKKLKKD